MYKDYCREYYFTQIYHKNYWGGIQSLSGKGSDKVQTGFLKIQLIDLVKQLNIKILIDAPCGDFNWMKDIITELNLDYYYGIDIVKELVDKLNKNYDNPKIEFQYKDIVISPLPKGDLLLCRDCLCHLTYESIFLFLENFIKLEIPYLLTTTFDKIRENKNLLRDGNGWFAICLLNEPFNFPEPIKLINEKCTEDSNRWTDKSLGLWNKEQIIEILKRRK
jgi:hypothetical protein